MLLREKRNIENPKTFFSYGSWQLQRREHLRLVYETKT